MAEDQWPGSVPLISEHDTWISVDPIVGCPANCKYCYLGPLELRGRKPNFRVAVDELADRVDRYLRSRNDVDAYGRLSRTPICFGNYTDTFMHQAGIDFFVEYAKLHAAHFPAHPLCVVTKARLSYQDLAALDELGRPILIFLSQSFLNVPGGPRVELGPTSTPADTVRNLRMFKTLHNVRPVHFLRPVTRRSVPSLDAAVEILAQVRGAGAVASVAVGLKLGAGVDLSAADANVVLGEDVPMAESAPEFFPPDARLHLLQAARIVDYPLYFNTSCAVALVTRREEDLGTWRVPMRWAKCEPCNCPRAQRSRCDSMRSQQAAPAVDELVSLASRYGLPDGSLSWMKSESAICLHNPVSQYTFNRLVHALPYRIVGRGVEPQEAWMGSFVREAERAVMPADSLMTMSPSNAVPSPVNDMIDDPPEEMRSRTDRLRSITGFVTTLHEMSDARPEVFGRYYHVRRVTWLASWLASRAENRDVQPNGARVMWLAWAHDLNRWPFAHNSEKGNFDQAADVGRYVRSTSLTAARERLGYHDDLEMLADLEGIIAKRVPGLSPEAEIVLLADIVAGLIEDPLLAVTGIDIRPAIIPADMCRELTFPMDQPEFRERLYRLNLLLYESRDTSSYVREFDALFRRCAISFVLAHSLTGQRALDRTSFGALRARVKEGLLRSILFPYNNEKISHGSKIRNELIDPLRRILGNDAIRAFTTITEDELVRMATENGLIGPEGYRDYIPDLDYLMNHEPENSFRNSFGR